jgi:hypothetical protein
VGAANRRIGPPLFVLLHTSQSPITCSSLILSFFLSTSIPVPLQASSGLFDLISVARVSSFSPWTPSCSIVGSWLPDLFPRPRHESLITGMQGPRASGQAAILQELQKFPSGSSAVTGPVVHFACLALCAQPFCDPPSHPQDPFFALLPVNLSFQPICQSSRPLIPATTCGLVSIELVKLQPNEVYLRSHGRYYLPRA